MKTFKKIILPLFLFIYLRGNSQFIAVTTEDCANTSQRTYKPNRNREIYEGKNEDLKYKKLTIYPNPTNGNLNVNFFETESKNVTISLEDVTGKLLFQQNISIDKGYSNNQFDLQNYLNGVYILKIIDSDQNLIKTEKIIINK